MGIRRGEVLRGARAGCVTCLLASLSGTAGAQTSGQDAAVGGAAGVSVSNSYVFRGVRQNTTGVAVRPFAAVSFTPYARDSTIEQIVVRVGLLNSLNTGDTGAGGPAAAAWYESRLSGGLGIRLAGDLTLDASFTAYTSPNGMFTEARELGLRVGWDDRAHRRLSLNPYAALAVEVGVQPGRGQLDGGQHAGRYLELGAAPMYRARRISVAVPVAVGLSVGDYYELGGKDHVFGFGSIGVEAQVPLGTTWGGRWSVRGGVGVQRLGTTARVFNDNERSLVVGTIGLGVER